jgi:hypothetical protein
VAIPLTFCRGSGLASVSALAKNRQTFDMNLPHGLTFDNLVVSNEGYGPPQSENQESPL